MSGHRAGIEPDLARQLAELIRAEGVGHLVGRDRQVGPGRHPGADHVAQPLLPERPDQPIEPAPAQQAGQRLQQRALGAAARR